MYSYSELKMIDKANFGNKPDENLRTSYDDLSKPSSPKGNGRGNKGKPRETDGGGRKISSVPNMRRTATLNKESKTIVPKTAAPTTDFERAMKEKIENNLKLFEDSLVKKKLINEKECVKACSKIGSIKGFYSEPNLTLRDEPEFQSTKKCRLRKIQSGGYIKTNEIDEARKTPRTYDIAETEYESCTPTATTKEVTEDEMEEEEKAKYDECLVTKKMDEAWTRFYDLKVKCRFSFFDELFKRGFVTDSLEVLGENQCVSSFVEASQSDYIEKVPYGRIVFKTKNIYVGNLKDWHFEGPGRYSWNDGIIFQGEFKDDGAIGAGTVIKKDGTPYEGQFDSRGRSGWGVESTVEGYTYAGRWFHGLPHGSGKIWYDAEDDEGNYYQGSWKKGVQDGYGVRLYPNGARYMGEWKEGLRSGNGTMIWTHERQVYRGEWANGMPNGEGEHNWYKKRTRINLYSLRHTYKGEWSEGMKHGIGRMMYPCGSVYEGRWVNGMRQGKGLLISSAGEILVGLFQKGSISGGHEVPLHTPTYECDYFGLIQFISKRFYVKISPDEEDKLADTTLKYLGHIRSLFNRAGELGTIYGNNGAYPNYMKKEAEKRPKDLLVSEEEVKEEKDDSFDINCCYFKNVEVTTKDGSPDGINPVTRLGLWLLLGDCKGLLQSNTMAEFDLVWMANPSISFQTRHNPFEPVYLWQFLQCLITVAVLLYYEIPEAEKRKRQGIGEVSDFEEEEEDPRLLKMRSLIKEKKEALLNPKPISPEVKPELPKSPGKAEKSRSKKSNSSKRSNSSKKSKSSKPSTPVKEKGEKKGKGKVKSKESTKSKESLKKSKTSIKEEEVEPVVVEEPLPIPDNLPPRKWADVVLNEETVTLGWTVPTECRDKVYANPYTKKDEPLKTKRKTKRFISISELFAKLLEEELIPCLDRAPGEVLPKVPNPLPQLQDLFEIFREIKTENIITGSDFLYHALPQISNRQDWNLVYWKRTRELVAPDSIDFEAFLDFMRAFNANKTANTKQRRSTFFSKLLRDFDESESMQVLKKDSQSFNIHGPLLSNKEDDDDVGDFLEDVLEEDEDAQEQHFSMFYDSISFGDDDLVSEPLAINQVSKCYKKPKTLKHFTFLSSKDVLDVLRSIYPKLVGDIKGENNVQFKMIFCDWLWAICECSRVSYMKELRLKTDLEESIPFAFMDTPLADKIFLNNSTDYCQRYSDIEENQSGRCRLSRELSTKFADKLLDSDDKLSFSDEEEL